MHDPSGSLRFVSWPPTDDALGAVGAGACVLLVVRRRRAE
jgi:hypothetical protein